MAGTREDGLERWPRLYHTNTPHGGMAVQM